MNSADHDATPGDDRDELHDKPIGELLKQLASETSTLVHQELELAKAEMKEKGRKAGPGFGMIGAAGAVALLALGALTAFLILALDGAMPNWLAALIVGLVYAAVAARALPARQGQGRGRRLARATADNRDAEGGRGMGETPDDIREDIEDTRARMGDTVEAIGYKADVPSRMKESVAEKKDSLLGSISGGAGAVAGKADALVSRVGGAVPDGGQLKDGAAKVGITRRTRSASPSPAPQSGS